MSDKLADQLEVYCRVATEHEARLVIRAEAVVESVVSFDGVLTGPFSAHGRTLTTDFRAETYRLAGHSQPLGELVVVDPCYWTPQLPFLYELNLEVQLVDGARHTLQRTIGLRRLQTSGASLRLDRVRYVLRGASASHVEASSLLPARDAEVALLVRAPNEDFCREASRVGVAIVADVRGVADQDPATIRRLARHASVMVVMTNAASEPLPTPSLSRPLMAVVAGAADQPDAAAVAPWADVIVVDFGLGERPPAWIADADKPAIAIRRGAAYAGLQQARNACDRLQADLAPQFNLAGYFVAP